MELEASVCSKCGSKGLAPKGTSKCFCGGDRILFPVTKDQYVKMSDYEKDKMIEEMNIHPLISKDDALTIYNVTRSTEIIDAMIELKQKDIIEYGLKLSQFKSQLEQQKSSKTKNDNCPKCPTCGSTNIEKISATKKVVGGAMFGLFSSDVRNSMHCKNCGCKW